MRIMKERGERAASGKPLVPYARNGVAVPTSLYVPCTLQPLPVLVLPAATTRSTTLRATEDLALGSRVPRLEGQAEVGELQALLQERQAVGGQRTRCLWTAVQPS
eukprot:366479-Chlamydomonas_euryale.AAC.7